MVANKLFGVSYGATTGNHHSKQRWPEDQSVVSLQGVTAWAISQELGALWGTADCIFGVIVSECQGIMGTWLLTIEPAIVLLLFFSQGFLSDSPWGEWIIILNL